MTTAAIILADSPRAESRIAALPLADRLAIAAARSGFSPIFIAAPASLTLPRSKAWGLDLHFLDSADDALSKIETPTLILSSSAYFDARSLRALIPDRPSAILDSDGNRLRAGILAAPLALDALDSRLAELPAVSLPGIALSLEAPDSLPRAEQALWTSLGSSQDGIFDTWLNRPIGRLLSKRLVYTPISPNQVTIIATLIGIAAALAFARNQALLGAFLFQLSAVIDCIDGDLARAVFKESAIGRWLDVAADQVVHIGIFAGMAFGLAATGATTLAWGLGISTCLGVLISFAIVARSMLQANPPEALKKLIESTATRDFSALIWIGAALGHIEWSLMIFAFGTHVFWILALITSRMTGEPAS